MLSAFIMPMSHAMADRNKFHVSSHIHIHLHTYSLTHIYTYTHTVLLDKMSWLNIVTPWQQTHALKTVHSCELSIEINLSLITFFKFFSFLSLSLSPWLPTPPTTPFPPPPLPPPIKCDVILMASRCSVECPLSTSCCLDRCLDSLFLLFFRADLDSCSNQKVKNQPVIHISKRCCSVIQFRNHVNASQNLNVYVNEPFSVLAPWGGSCSCCTGA